MFAATIPGNTERDSAAHEQWVLKGSAEDQSDQVIELILRANDLDGHVELLAHLERRREHVRRRVLFWALFTTYIVSGLSFATVFFIVISSEAAARSTALLAGAASVFFFVSSAVFAYLVKSWVERRRALRRELEAEAEQWLSVHFEKHDRPTYTRRLAG